MLRAVVRRVRERPGGRTRPRARGWRGGQKLTKYMGLWPLRARSSPLLACGLLAPFLMHKMQLHPARAPNALHPLSQPRRRCGLMQHVYTDDRSGGGSEPELVVRISYGRRLEAFQEGVVGWL